MNSFKVSRQATMLGKGKMMMMKFLFSTGALLLSGCATPLYDPITVTYTTDPPGARLYEGSKHLGQAPHTASYLVSIAEKSQGYKVMPIVTAVWPDGKFANTPKNAVMFPGDVAIFKFSSSAAAHAHSNYIYQQKSKPAYQAPSYANRESVPSQGLSRDGAEGLGILLGIIGGVAAARNSPSPSYYPDPILLESPRTSSGGNMMRVGPPKEYDCRINSPDRATCIER